MHQILGGMASLQRAIMWFASVQYFGPAQFKETVCLVNGKNSQGKALYAKAKAIYAAA